MAEPAPKFDARLEEGVRYFEQMLQLMPDDRTTLEFLVVAYDQLNEKEKGENAVVSLTKLLLKQGDFAAAEGLLPRLEAIESEEAKILALKVHRLAAPGPELVPETPKELTPAELSAEEIRLFASGAADGSVPDYQLAALLMAFNIKIFVRAGGLYPGGVTGVTVLIQRAAQRFWGLEIPYAPLNIALNLLPIYIGFRYIGKILENILNLDML